MRGTLRRPLVLVAFSREVTQSAKKPWRYQSPGNPRGHPLRVRGRSVVPYIGNTPILGLGVFRIGPDRRKPAKPLVVYWVCFFFGGCGGYARLGAVHIANWGLCPTRRGQYVCSHALGEYGGPCRLDWTGLNLWEALTAVGIVIGEFSVPLFHFATYAILSAGLSLVLRLGAGHRLGSG